MRLKLRKRLRHLARDKGHGQFLELPLEFEGKRAFVVWDWAVLGQCRFTARIEINPKLLQRIGGTHTDYCYHGQLVLPRPEDN